MNREALLKHQHIHKSPGDLVRECLGWGLRLSFLTIQMNQVLGKHTLHIKNIENRKSLKVLNREAALCPVCSRKTKSDGVRPGRLDWEETVDCCPQCWFFPGWEASVTSCYPGPTIQDSHLIFLEWGPDFCICEKVLQGF
jgi:hypothetical protein